VVDIAQAETKIKAAGKDKVRIVPMAGQSIQDGLHQIEINEGGNWKAVLTGAKKSFAESVVSQALNRVICG
jgi:hypothetical protein